MAVGQPDVEGKAGTQDEPCAVCGKADDFRKLLRGAGFTTSASGSDSEQPPDGETLGKHTWTFLHTMAAYYPSKPSIQVCN